ncbi:MAG: tetratricopeptide repeat protein [Elusimicrobia bacterium]|nr:tetratricopeptide repeat protein [Elusimicrobiota bacterium]
MNKLIKPLMAAVAAALAGYVWFAVLGGSRKEACFNMTGKPAVEACSFVIRWRGGAEKAEALYRRSRLYASGEAWDDEKADLEALLAMKDSARLGKERLGNVYVGLALVATRKGDEAAARKYSELAVQTGNASSGVYLSLAGAYIEAKQYKQAADLLLGAAIPDSEKKHPYYNALASAYGGMGDYPRAYYALKSGLAVKAPRPVLAATAKQMGLVCFELKRYKEADMYLSYAQRSGADCPECPLLLTTIRESLMP